MVTVRGVSSPAILRLPLTIIVLEPFGFCGRLCCDGGSGGGWEATFEQLLLDTITDPFIVK